MKKTLSIVSRSIPAHGPGGMERATWLVAAGLANLGWDVEVITTSLPANTPVELDGVRIRAITGSPPARYSRIFYQEVRRILGEGPVDAPVIAISAAGFDYLALPQSKRRPVMLVCHGTSWDEIRSKWRSRTFRSLVGLIRQLLWIPKDLAAYRRAERIVTVNDPITEQIIRLLPTEHRQKVATVYNGFRTEDTNATHEAHCAPAEFVLCTSGRLVREKGIHLLLEACALLAPEQRPAEITVCGDGPELPTLRNQADRLALRNVSFTGHIGNVMPYVRRSTAVVLPSLRLEGLPMSVIEALSAGCQAIIPSSLQFPDVKQPGILRFVSGDPKDLARVLLIAKKAGRHAGLVHALTLDTMIRNYAEVLSALSGAVAKA